MHKSDSTKMSEPFLIAGMPTKQSRTRSLVSVNPTVSAEHIFEAPAKLIKTPADMKIWEKSEGYFEYVGFILAINEAIKGKSNSQGSANVSDEIVKLVGMLDKLDIIIDETPPIQQPQRFGNQAFRTWFQTMKNESMNLLQEVIRPELNKSVPEIIAYLVESFGNSTRIDYGTGHEISFVMFLCCLFKIGFLKEADKVATGCLVFPRYLDLARKLQKTYRMEPAGSHGVWSLDDYQFIPFIWGSSQLVAHPVIEPKMFLNESILNQYGEDFMFLTCIQYINSVKTGPFAEHSNQLWSISGVSSWSKINGGLVKMYKAEVLSKFPVIQHMVFGSLFTLKAMEQCTGMMTPKYPMMPPPVASSRSSDSSKESTRSSESEVRNEELASQASSLHSVDRTKGSATPSKGSSPASRPSSVRGSESSDQTSTRTTDTTTGSEDSEIGEQYIRGSKMGDAESTGDTVRFGSVQISDGEGHGRRQTKMPM